MVMCVVVGCSKRSGRDRDVSFFRIPKVVSGKGPQNLLELSKKRRAGYLAAISRIGVTDKIRTMIGSVPNILFRGNQPIWKMKQILTGFLH